jgi:lysophospholipase L1-like esterase
MVELRARFAVLASATIDPGGTARVTVKKSRGDSDPNGPVVACLGSSSTSGKGQAFDWIGELRRRPQNARRYFHNFGVGGDLAYNALQRLPAVLACRPTMVVVWVGANDVLALVSAKVRRVFEKWKRLPTEPSFTWFSESIQTITERLKNESSARIGLCSLPPIGEDPLSVDPFQSELNRRIAEHSTIIHEIALAKNVSYIPLYEAVHRQLRASPGQAFTSFEFLPFYRDAFRVLVLGKNLDEVAQMNGWRFHTDGVHLNSRGGIIVANVIQEFLDDCSRPESIKQEGT